MKAAWFYLSRTFLIVLSFIVLYVVFSLILSAIPGNEKIYTGQKNKRIYLFSNGVHLDIVLPVEYIAENLRTQILHDPETVLLGIGWGDKGFYLDTPTWAELRASVAIKAMFLPSPTAMHVTEHRRVYSQWSYVDITEEQLAELNAYILKSFRTDTDGKISELVGKGYTPQDRFYEAHGNYSCFKTCNTWVNTAMRRIGVKTAIWTPLDTGILRYHRKVEDKMGQTGGSN